MNKRVWQILAAVYALAIFIGSAIPGSDLPSVVTSVSDKLLHIAEYAVLGFIVHRGISDSTRLVWARNHPIIVAAAVALVYAASDEFHQLFVPGRMAEIADWCADGIGALIGIVLSAWALPLLLKRFARSRDERTLPQ